MTDDKDFKQLVRDEARRTGRRYTEVRTELRPDVPAEPMEPAEVKERFDEVVSAIETWVYGKHEVVQLVATALLVPGNVLFRDMPGNGMTMLGNGVAAAIGADPIAIDGRSGLNGRGAAAWRPNDVVVISHLDGLSRADQLAVVQAGRTPTIVLAKRHVLDERMPYPPDDETRDRFLFGLSLGYADSDTELRIVNEVRDRSAGPRQQNAISLHELAAMRAAATAVEVPENVRRFIVAAMAATRTDDALLLGASSVATLALVQATAAAAVADGRATASVEDAQRMLGPTLAHRVVFRDGFAIRELVARITARAGA